MEEGEFPVIPEFTIRKRPAHLLEVGNIKYQVLERSNNTEGWPFHKELSSDGKKMYKPLEVGLIPLNIFNDSAMSYKRAINAFGRHLENNDISEANVIFLSETKTPEADIPIMYDKFESYMGKRGWEITGGDRNTYHLAKKLR